MTIAQQVKVWIRAWSKSFLGTTSKVLWTAFLTALFVAAINRFHVLDWFGFGPPPSVSAQLEQIRREEAARRRHTVYSSKLDLHGSGNLSYLLVFRDDRVDYLDASAGEPEVSDEVRIYESRNGVLEAVYRFRPRSTDPLDRPYLFQIETAEDIDGNGEVEVIGAYAPIAMEPFAPVPLILDWDDEAGYGMRPLVGDPPLFELLRTRGTYAEAVQGFYTRPTALTDPRTGESVRGHAVEDFSVLLGRDEPVMIATFIVKAPSHANVELIQLMGWQINVQNPHFPSESCYTLKPIFTKVAIASSQLSRAWSKREKSFC